MLPNRKYTRLPKERDRQVILPARLHTADEAGVLIQCGEYPLLVLDSVDEDWERLVGCNCD